MAHFTADLRFCLSKFHFLLKLRVGRTDTNLFDSNYIYRKKWQTDKNKINILRKILISLFFMLKNFQILKLQRFLKESSPFKKNRFEIFI